MASRFFKNSYLDFLQLEQVCRIFHYATQADTVTHGEIERGANYLKDKEMKEEQLMA